MRGSFSVLDFGRTPAKSVPENGSFSNLILPGSCSGNRWYIGCIAMAFFGRDTGELPTMEQSGMISMA